MGVMGYMEAAYAVNSLLEARDAAGRGVKTASIDAIDVDVYVGGEKMDLAKTAKLSDYRFEGYVHPAAYFGGNGGNIMRSPWTESGDDVWAALTHFRANRSRHQRIVHRKAKRFRVGTYRDETPREAWYYRDISMNATAWLEVIRNAGMELSGTYVNFGAGNGVTDDPMAHFAQNDVRQYGRALAVEADPKSCEAHRHSLPWVHLACERITMRNVDQLLNFAFPTSSMRAELDVLKVDIDSYEGPIVEECLWRAGLHPKLLLIEVNSGIPPPLQFALLDSPQLQQSYPEIFVGAYGKDLPLNINKPIAGVSLSYLVQRLSPAYALLELGSPDAIFVRKDVLDLLGRAPLDEFDAFAHRWSDVHGFSRYQVRKWFFEMDEIEALGDVFDYLTSWMKRFLRGRMLPFTLTY